MDEWARVWVPNKLIRPTGENQSRNNKKLTALLKDVTASDVPTPRELATSYHLTPHVPDQAVSQGERSPNCHPIAQSLPVKMYGFAPEILCPH